MAKLLYLGDIHIRGNTPRSRMDDYPTALKRKLREVFLLAKEHGVTAIICAGDIFDMPQVSTGVLLDFMSVFKESPVPIYTTAGNHDIYGYNLATYDRTSLRLLELLVPQLTVVNDPTKVITLPLYPGCGPNEAVALTFTPYSGHMDLNGYGYSPEGFVNPAHFNIHTAHGMLLDHKPPFDRFTLVQEVETKADLVLTGHDHIGYGVFNRADRKKFVNCGSLTRLSASTGEITRPIQVALITVGQDKAYEIDLIRLQSAAPGSEILDRSEIEKAAQRQYSMENFAALIQAKTGETVLMDVNGIVETIASQESFAPEVVKLALEKIDEQRVFVQ